MPANLLIKGSILNTDKAVKFDVRRIYKGGTKTLISRFLGVSLLFGLHIMLGNALGTAQYGLYSFALSTVGLLMNFAALGLPTALMRYVVQYTEQDKLNELKGALHQLPVLSITSSLAFSAILLFVIIPLLPHKEWVQGFQYSAYLLPIFVLEQIRRNLYKSYSRPISSLIPDEIIRPILLGLWVWLFHISDSSTVIILYIAVTLSLAIGFLGWLYRHLKQALSGLRPKYETKTWLKTALPMAYGSIGYLMMNQTDAIMLGMFEKMHVVGVYMASNRIAMLSQIILGSAAIIVVPMITSAFHGGRMNEFHSILSHTRIWIVTLTLPLFLVMVFFPNPLLKLFGDAYSEGEWVLRILAMGQFVNAAAGPLGLALTMTGRQSLLAKIMLLAAVLKIGLNIVIIPLFSAVGAATVTMCCLILLNFALFIIIKKSISFVDSTSGITE